MSRYLGDFLEDAVIYVDLTTNDAYGGRVAPSSAFETSDFKIYMDDETAEKVTVNGLTISSPWDTLTGVHALKIDTSIDTGETGNFEWATGHDYKVVLYPDETVDSQSVSAVVAKFSIKNRNSIGYTNGSVFIDTTNGSGTGIGTPDDPITTLPAGKTKADALNMNRLTMVGSYSADNLATSDFSDGYEFFSEGGGKLDLGNADVEKCSFKGFHIEEGDVGVDSGSGYVVLENCRIGADSGSKQCNIPRVRAKNCQIESDVFLAESGTYIFNGLDCTQVDDYAVLDFNNSTPADPGASVVRITGFTGRLVVKNMKTTDVLDITGIGVVLLDATCNSGSATADIRGAIKLTDASTLMGVFDHTIFKSVADLNDLSAGEVNVEVDNALADINLDHLMKVAVTGGDVIDNSALAKIVSKSATADWDTFLNTSDSLEAIRDNVTLPSLKKNTAVSNYKFVMLDETTGLPKTGLTVTAQRCLDDSSFTTMANSVSERAYGLYEIDIAAADCNADTGAWRFTASGARAVFITFITES